MTDSSNLSKGDRVSWAHAQGRSTGRIVRKLTSDTTIKDFKVSASEDDPRFLVESEDTAEQAAHKPEALRKLEKQD